MSCYCNTFAALIICSQNNLLQVAIGTQKPLKFTDIEYTSMIKVYKKTYEEILYINLFLDYEDIYIYEKYTVVLRIVKFYKKVKCAQESQILQQLQINIIVSVLKYTHCKYA